MTKTVILGVSGSISAYKAADIVSGLKKKGYNIEVVITKAAQGFITPLTLQVLSQNHVHVDVMDEPDVSKVNHIQLAKDADLFVIAPGSANIIGKIANGIADDLLSTIALAIPETTPKLIAPAMNTQMYAAKAVRRNMRQLEEDGWEEILPREALLACGDWGRGALAEVPVIIEAIEEKLK
ncbi:MAG: phosphopantothenoylcysteine decarboxylase [Streptococcaceae bacterium]|jgi:phosphopantothenoylcysteine decarboxylase|nr:phosphopantothenoylcysteine decarboxylase [Streptococcaceae bacterium]